jgi:hypothetical protein
MLSKKDLKQIRTIIQEELKAAFTVEIQYEKYDKDKGMKELKTEKHFLPEWLVDLQPHLIGALRGMQEDTNKANNKMINTADNVNKMTEIMLLAENSMKCIAALSDKTKEVIQIENND